MRRADTMRLVQALGGHIPVARHLNKAPHKVDALLKGRGKLPDWLSLGIQSLAEARGIDIGASKGPEQTAIPPSRLTPETRAKLKQAGYDMGVDLDSLSIVSGAVFKGKRVPLDGRNYESCEFIDCTFEYAGIEPFIIGSDCVIQGETTFDFMGFASNTLNAIGYLEDIGVSGIIDQVIAKIKANDTF
jgi:hypothetical protein